MDTLNALVPMVEQRRIARRAWAAHHLTLAAEHAVYQPGDTADRNLAFLIQLSRKHGLEEQEIQDIIRTVREEAQHYG